MVHRYLARDAIANRAVFLLVLGFIAIFCVCIARNGVLDNVEWIRDRILLVDTSDLDARRLLVRSMSNTLPLRGPLALVVGATELQARGLAPYRMLQGLEGQFRAAGMNLSAFVWVMDSDAVWAGDQCAHDPALGWGVQVLTRRNATTMEALLLYLLQGMDVGVLYMDAGAVSVGAPGMPGADVHVQGDGGPASLAAILGLGTGGVEEDVVLLSMFTEAHMAYMAAVLRPPSMPFVDASLLVAWPTEPSVGLFREASERVHALLLLPWVGNTSSGSALPGPAATPRALSSYVLSTTPNDGRGVVRVTPPRQGPTAVQGAGEEWAGGAGDKWAGGEGRQELAFRHLPREGFNPAAPVHGGKANGTQAGPVGTGACTDWGIVCCIS